MHLQPTLMLSLSVLGLFVFLNLPDGKSWPAPPKIGVSGKSLSFQFVRWSGVAEEKPIRSERELITDTMKGQLKTVHLFVH